MKIIRKIGKFGQYEKDQPLVHRNRVTTGTEISRRRKSALLTGNRTRDSPWNIRMISTTDQHPQTTMRTTNNRKTVTRDRAHPSTI
jgi:hypothetical protein